MRVAPAFHDVIRLSRVLLMMASSDEATRLARRTLSTSPWSRSVRSTSKLIAPMSRLRGLGAPPLASPPLGIHREEEVVRRANKDAKRRTIDRSQGLDDGPTSLLRLGYKRLCVLQHRSCRQPQATLRATRNRS